MPNYGLYPVLLLDSILLFAVYQQLSFRYRILNKYSHLDIVKEQVVHKRKDIYRWIVALLLSIKTSHSICWLCYQGWGDSFNLQKYIKLYYFWIFYGVILSISYLITGDFAAVVVGIERNIKKNGKKKRLWKGLLMGASVLSVIIAMWGVFLSIGIQNTPIWQYMGFSISLLNGFVTYVMLKSILNTTRETQESTYHVRPSITAKEFEKQLFTLFNMKQIVAALIFIAIYAIFAFISNLYYIVDKKIIYQPFIGNSKWYLYAKLTLFNCYIYSTVSIFLIYTWISYGGIRELAIKAKRKDTLTTPNDPENDIVIMPDIEQMVYPPNIDPNDPDNRPSDTDIDLPYINGSRRNSLQTHTDTMNTMNKRNVCINLQPITTNKGDKSINHSPISANSGPPTPRYMDVTDPTSPSKFSVLSNTATVDHDIIHHQISPKAAHLHQLQPNNNNNDIFEMFGRKISIGHQTDTSEINIDFFMRESRKLRPHKTMLDLPIISMQRNGCSLERIYFDAQKIRGITPKSLKLTAKMRSISYSPNGSRYHSRRSTMKESIYSPLSKTKNKRSSQSVPNMLARNKNDANCTISTLDTLSTVDTISGDHSIGPHSTKLIAGNTSSDTNATMDIDDDLSQSNTQISHYQLIQHKYSDSNTIDTESSTKCKPNVHIINMRDPINVTVPEDAVLTPEKDHRSSPSLDIDIKTPQYSDNKNIINEDNEDPALLHDYNSNISNSNESDNQEIPHRRLNLSKQQIYSNSTSLNENK